MKSTYGQAGHSSTLACWLVLNLSSQGICLRDALCLGPPSPLEGVFPTRSHNHEAIPGFPIYYFQLPHPIIFFLPDFSFITTNHPLICFIFFYCIVYHVPLSASTGTEIFVCFAHCCVSRTWRSPCHRGGGQVFVERTNTTWPHFCSG